MSARRVLVPVALAAGVVPVLGSALALAPPASAGPSAPTSAAVAATCVRVTETTSGGVDQVGVARGSDGVLHVVWLQPSTGTYFDTPVAPPLKAGSPTVISKGWFEAADPDAVTGRTGVAAFWNGVRSDAANSPHGTFEATRPLSGGSWTTRPTPVVPGTTTGDGADTTAVAGTDGTYWTAYTGTGVLHVQRQGSPGHDVAPANGSAYDPGLATDGGTGDVWVGFFSYGSGTTGTLVQEFDGRTGAPTGSRQRLPGSVTQGNADDPEQPVAVSGLGTGHAGMYAAYGSGYPSLRAVQLWDASTGTATALERAGGGRAVDRIALGADGAGGLWLAWTTTGSGVTKLFVAHSDRSVSTWSAPEQVSLPKGTSAVYQVQLDGQPGSVDLVLRLDQDYAGKVADWVTRVAG